MIITIVGCDRKASDTSADRLTETPDYKYEATVGHSAISPSGKYRLDVFLEESDSRYYFVIVDVKSGEELYKYEGYNGYELYALHTTWFIWDGDNAEEDVVWCYSGDLGLFYWRLEGDNWKMHNGGIGEYAPVIFKERRPKDFK